MISEKYLNLLDTLYVEPDLTLDYVWLDLQTNWKYGIHSRIKDTLITLAEVSYTMLSHELLIPLPACILRAKDLHRRKNAGYSGVDNPDPWDNFRECETFGISAVDGCLTRLCDKYRRYKNITTNPANEQVGENVAEALVDLGAYSLILICLLEE